MAQERDVACAVHGASHAAFVCTHLLSEPGQAWFCDYPSKNNPSPDAWCAACEALFDRDGGWSDEASAHADIKLICGQCYLGKLAMSVPALEAQVKAPWAAFTSECRASLAVLQQQMDSTFDVSGYDRYDYDLATKRIVFSTHGVPLLEADIEVVGSHSRVSGTWMWSWAKFGLPLKVRTRMKRVRALGEERAFPKLTTHFWPADACDAWDMAAIAAHVLKASGVYRSPGESSDVYFTLSKLRLCC